MPALYSLVQSGSTATGTGSVALTLPGSTTPGTCLIACLVVSSTSSGVTAPNANWRLAQSKAVGGTGTGKTWIWYLEGKYHTGTGSSFTFTGPGGATMTGSVDEYALPGNYSLFFECTGIASGGSGSITAASLPASAGSTADCLGIACFGATFSATQAGQSWNAITGWTKSGGQVNATLNYQMYRNLDVAYSTGVSLSGGYSTATNATGWAACLGLFRARLFIPDGLVGVERMTGSCIDPTGQVIIGTGDVEGMWRSCDAGDHWQPTQNNLYAGGENQTAGATWSQLEPGTVYAALGAFSTHFGGAGFYASPDGGVTWVKRNGSLHYNSQNPGTPPSPAGEGGGGDRAIGNHLFAQDPARGLLYTAAYDSFQRSANNGNAWTDLSASIPGTRSNLYCRAVVANGKEVYLATWNVGPSSNGGTGTAIQGVYHTSDATVGSPSWTQCTGYTGTIADLVIVGGYVYVAGGKGGLYRCKLGSTALNSLNGAGSAAYGAATLTGLQTGGSILYNSVDGFVDGSGNHQIYAAVGGVGKPSGVSYNPGLVQVTLPNGTTTGMTWTDCLNQPGGSVTINHILPQYQGTYERDYWGSSLAYKNFLGGGAWDGGGRITVNQVNPQQMFMTGQGGITRSDDGGKTWNNAVNGIDMMSFHNVAWDTVNANHWVVVSEDHAEMDVNGDWTGYTAAGVTEQLPAGNGYESHAVALDPVDGTTFIGTDAKYSSATGGGVYARAWNRPSDATEIGYITATGSANLANSPSVVGLYAGRDGSNNYFILVIAQAVGLYRATCPHASDPTVKANWSWTGPATGDPSHSIGTNGTIGQVNKFAARTGSSAAIYCFDKRIGLFRSTNYGINTGGSTWTLIYPKVIGSTPGQAGDLAINPDVAGEVWVTTSDNNGLRRLSGAGTGIIGQAGGGTDTGIAAPAALGNAGSIDWWNGQPYVVTIASGSATPQLWTCAGDPTVGGNWSNIGGPEFQQYLANPGRITAISAAGQIIIASPSNNAVIGTLGGTPLLTVQTSALSNAQVGVAYSFTLLAQGGQGPDTWARIAGTLPAGLSLNTSTGVISGTPTTAGTSAGLQFQVTDSESPAVTATSPVMSLLVTATAQVTITTTTVPAGTVGTAYSTTLAVINGTAPYTWAKVSGSGPLPAGLSISTGGVISGTPTTAGSYPFTVQVTDAGSNTATQPLTILVASSALTVQTTSPLTPGQVGVPYIFGLSANGGVRPYTWAQTAGTLPAGLSLDTNGSVTGTPGTITGTPTTVGTSSGMTFRVTDSATPAANTATSPSLSLQVTAAALNITTTGLPAGTEGVPYPAVPGSSTLAAVNGTTPYTWSVASGTLPAGLSLNTSTGVISGTPTTGGPPAVFIIQCTDSSTPTPQTDQQPLSISIPSGALGISFPRALPPATAGQSYQVQFIPAGGIPPYTWSVQVPRDGSTFPLPAGFTLDPATGILAGSTATTTGSTPVTFQVTDSIGSTAAIILSLAVIAPTGTLTTAAAWHFLVAAPQPDGTYFGEAAQAQSRTVTFRTGATLYSEASVDMLGTDPAAAYVTELQTDLQVLYAGQVLFCGRIGATADQLSAGGHRFQPTALDYREILRRRDFAYGGGPNCSSQDVADIAWNLIRPGAGPDGRTGVQGYPGGNLGISRGIGAGGVGVTQTANYVRQMWAGQEIDNLAQMNPGGFDWDVSPYSADDLRLDIWSPSRGVNRGVVLDLGGNLISSIQRTVDPSTYANSVFVTGATSGGTQLFNNNGASPSVGALDASDITRRVEGRWDQIVGTQLTSQSAVNSAATFYLTDGQVVVPSYVIQLYPGSWQGPGWLWLGDTVTVRINSGRLLVNDQLRVQEMNFTISPDNIETLTVTLGRPPYQIGQQIPRMLRRLRDLESI